MAERGGPEVTLGERRAALGWIAAAQIGAMSTWFSAAAVATSLARDWHLSSAAVALLTVAVQVGFVAGALGSAVSGIADVLPTRAVFVAGALAAAGANGFLIGTGGDLRLALPLRFLLGVFLAGVYPTGMKLMTGWFREDRGLAIGVLVGALTIGAAFPHLVAGIGLAGLFSWQRVIAATSLGAVASAAIVGWLVRDGPHHAPPARVDLPGGRSHTACGGIRADEMLAGGKSDMPSLARLLAAYRPQVVVLLASVQASGAAGGGAAGRWASLWGAVVIGAGALGCVAAGLLADRVGRTLITAAAMAISGSCAVATGLLFGRSPALVVAVAAAWGISVIADSAQFSAAISELVEPNRVGSALALQTAAGFLLTAISIQIVPAVVRGAHWSEAFGMLAVGPALGAVAMLRLRVRPEAVRLAGGRR